MSSEPFNIKDVDLAEEKKGTKFVVDELGLNKSLSKIPTDVEYFLKEQRGTEESSFDFGQAFRKSLDLENTGVVLRNKYSDSLSKNFKADPNYMVSKEQFDEIETYPEYIREAFTEARSDEHFYDIKQQVDKRLDIERNLAQLGWKGFSARMLAAATDPIAITLSVGSSGLLAPLIYGGKIARLKRAVKFGALVGTENAIIESGLVALDPLKDANDIKYAMYGGFALGAPIGGLARKNKDILKAYNNLQIQAKKAMSDIESNEVNDFAAGINVKPNEIFMQKKRLTNGVAKNKYDFTVTSNSKEITLLDDTPDALSVKEKEWRTGKAKLFGFIPVPRFSMSSSLNASPDPNVQKFAELAMPDPVVGSKSGDTMIEYKENKMRQILYPFNNSRDVAYQSFLKKDIGMNELSQAAKVEKFNEIIADIIEFPDIAKTYTNITPEMVKHASYGANALDDIKITVAQSGREGWSDIAKSGAILNYFPHTHSQTKLRNAIDEYGVDEVVRLYGLGLRKQLPDMDEKKFNKMIKGIVDNISSTRYFGKEASFARGFQGTNEAGFKEFLEDIGLDKEQIEAIAEKFKTKEGVTLDPNARRRLPFDLTSKIEVKSLKTGKTRGLSLKDLTDRNAERVINKYSNQVLGQAAMARFGGFINNREYDKFINRIKNDNKNNIDYQKKDFSNHLDILDVISSSILGRRNPLEANDPSGIKARRIARLIGDYNFLRLFGQVGFAQGAELFGALGEAGWLTSLRAMPNLADLHARLRSGNIDIKDPFLKELQAYGAPVGLDKYMNSPTARLEGDDVFLMDDTATALNNIEIKTGKGKRFLADFSFLNPMTMMSQVWSSKALTMKIVDRIMDLSKTYKSNKIYQNLKLGDQVRFRQLGWTKNEFNNVAKNIKKHALIENGDFKALNLDNWDIEARSAYVTGISRWIDRVVQRSDLASMNKWFTNDFVKLIIQFRTFSLSAYEKQLLNGVYTLDQTRGRDFETWSRFTSSMIGAATFASAQIYINSFGMRNREEYLKERLSPSNVAKIAFLRSAWSTLIPAGIGTVNAFFSEEDFFGYGRNTELSSRLVAGIPSVNLGENIIRSTRMLTKVMTDPNYKPSESELKKSLSILALHNGIVIKNINNMVVDKLAK